MIKQCGLCGSDKIIPGATIEDKGRSVEESLEIEIDRKREALFLRGSVRGALRAWICAECGNVELFVDNPGELYQAYLDAQEHQRQFEEKYRK